MAASINATASYTTSGDTTRDSERGFPDAALI